VSRRPLPLLLTIALAAVTVLLSTVPARAQLTEADVFVAEGVVALDDKSTPRRWTCSARRCGASRSTWTRCTTPR
jgi:hypothetical protein